MKILVTILALLSCSTAFGVNASGWYTSTRGSELTLTHRNGDCFRGSRFERYSYTTYYPRLRKSFSGRVRIDCKQGPRGHYAKIRSSSRQIIDGVYCSRTGKFTWYDVDFGRWGRYTIHWHP